MKSSLVAIYVSVAGLLTSSCMAVDRYKVMPTLSLENNFTPPPAHSDQTASIWLGFLPVIGGAKHAFIQIRDENNKPIYDIHGHGYETYVSQGRQHFSDKNPLRGDVLLGLIHSSRPYAAKTEYIKLFDSHQDDIAKRALAMVVGIYGINRRCLPYNPISINDFSINSNSVAGSLLNMAGLGQAAKEKIGTQFIPGFDTALFDEDYIKTSQSSISQNSKNLTFRKNAIWEIFYFEDTFVKDYVLSLGEEQKSCWSKSHDKKHVQDTRAFIRIIQ